MTAITTEHLHESAAGLDNLQLEDVATLLARGQVAAAKAAENAISSICAGAAAMAHSIRVGGSLHFAAAGSSGLMAAADAQELGGTFSIPPTQVYIHMAGGLPTGVEMPGGTEDDTEGLQAGLSLIGDKDTLIAVSASGSTPYTVAAAGIAKANNATVIGIANNDNSELLKLADHKILLETPPEVLSGSTRMGAGTAQKIALNMLSTMMAVQLGHIYDGMMVNLRADNIKLRARACSIVAKIANVRETAALQALNHANGDVKTAILVAGQGLSLDAAQALLKETSGHLRPALERAT